MPFRKGELPGRVLSETPGKDLFKATSVFLHCVAYLHARTVT